MFSTSLHTLEADGFRGTMLGLLLAVGLLGAWGAWFIGAQVALYAVSEMARLEMSQAAHPVEATVAGRVMATHLTLGQEVALMARQYPGHRNVTLRLLEPLGAPEETSAPAPGPAVASHAAHSPAAAPSGVAIVMEGVSVRAAGHTILDKIDLDIDAGPT